jgi:hypothetical protein
MDLASNLKQIKEAYENDNNYYEGVLDGYKYKIRMNKNHPRNSQRNDDLAIHNLSLVNVKYPSAVGRKIINKKIQKQVDNITDWEDAEIEIEEFFNEIKDEDFDKKYKKGGNINVFKYTIGGL